MGQPVVHFEVIGKDGEGLRNYYSELFGWGFGETVGPTNYADSGAQREHERRRRRDRGRYRHRSDGYDGHVTFYVEVPDVGGAGEGGEPGRHAGDGPDKVPDVGIEIGLFSDPEGHVIGLVK